MNLVAEKIKCLKTSVLVSEMGKKDAAEKKDAADANKPPPGVIPIFGGVEGSVRLPCS